jgi:hypothetical protein
MEFRLERYREFRMAFGALSGNPTYETQSRFVDSLNVILLVGSADLLRAVDDLVENYNDAAGTAESQRPILDRILFQMRCDLGMTNRKELAGFEFPIIIPGIPPAPERKVRKD